MIAVLLYLIGLVSVVVTAVMVGSEVPMLYEQLMAAIRLGHGSILADNVIAHLQQQMGRHAWVVMPLLGGLLLMGFARVMMLLGAINRAVRQGV